MNPLEARDARRIENQNVGSAGVFDRYRVSADLGERREYLLEDRLDRFVTNDEDATNVMAIIVMIEVRRDTLVLAEILAAHDTADVAFHIRR